MPPKKRKNKKDTKPLDLSVSETTETDKQFVVETYDYAELQVEKTTAEIQFEDDLKFLMADGSESKVALGDSDTLSNGQAKNPASKAKKWKKTASKPVKVSLKEITQDIDDITFSTDDETTEAKQEKPKKKKKSKKLDKIAGNGNVDAAFEPETDTTSIPKDNSIEETESSPVSEQHEEVKTEVSETVAPELSEKERLKREKRKAKQKEKKRLLKEAKKAQKTEKEGDRELEVTQLAPAVGSEKAKESTKESEQSLETQSDSVQEKKTKSKSRTKEVLQTGSDSSSFEFSPTPESKADSPFVKLRSSAAALKLRQLPEIQPTKTFIGVSHSQIMLMRENDVKYKTILSAPLMSKLAKNAIRFLSRKDVFTETPRKIQFCHLCVAVALHESNGFQNICQKYLDLESWLGQFEELTLEHTRTNLTVLSRQAHSNNLDYSVFSYLGHIIIWATYLQSNAGVSTIIEKYGMEITRKEILALIGGFHLWDRIRRDEKSINTKRWKHIQKFRLIFAYEEDQFVLILRLMDLGVEIP